MFQDFPVSRDHLDQRGRLNNYFETGMQMVGWVETAVEQGSGIGTAPGSPTQRATAIAPAASPTCWQIDKYVFLTHSQYTRTQPK
jgi:hypothetical protein